MRTSAILIGTLLVIACNNSDKKKEDTKTKDTAAAVNQAPPAPPVQALPDTIFNGFGTEPFWSVFVVKDVKIVFHPADGTDVEVPFVAPASPAARMTKYSSANAGASIELTIIEKICNDGMSELDHPYQVVLLVNKTKYSGCGKD